MKKYTYKEVAEIIGISQSLVNGKTKRKKFPEEFKTTVINEQNREVKALTEEGLQRLKDEYGITDKRVNEENKNLLGNLELVKQGDFLGTKCDFYKDTNDNIYMTRKQIAEALEYKDEEYVKKLHKNNKKTFDSLSVEISRFNRQGISDTPIKNGTNTSYQDNMGVDNIRQNVGEFKASALHPDTLLYNEDGVYEITFLSRQPRANEFRAWVRERIKEIRKYGFTTQTNKDGTHNVQAMAEFLHGKEESAGKLAFVALAEWKIKATMELEKQKDLISTQNEQLEQQKPKVRFAEQVAVSKDSITVNEMAKLLHKNGVNIGRNRLFQWLRDKKLVMRVSDGQDRYSNIPTQTAVNKGLLTIVEKTYTDAWGESRISTTTVVTPKGQDYILKKFFVGAFFE